MPGRMPFGWITCSHCHGVGSCAGVACVRCNAQGFVKKDAVPCPCYGCREDRGDGEEE